MENQAHQILKGQHFNAVQRITAIAVLSSLGTVLMLFEIPVLVMAIDLSDVVILITFFLFSWREAFAVAFFKTAAHVLFRGAVGPIAIGQISAFIASSMYVFGFYIAIRLLRLKRRISISLCVIIVVSIAMIIANYFLVTPVYLGMSLSEARAIVTPQMFGIEWFDAGYWVTILTVFAAFNLLKGSIILPVFWLLREPIRSYLDHHNVNP